MGNLSKFRAGGSGCQENERTFSATLAFPEGVTRPTLSLPGAPRYGPRVSYPEGLARALGGRPAMRRRLGADDSLAAPGDALRGVARVRDQRRVLDEAGAVVGRVCRDDQHPLLRSQ